MHHFGMAAHLFFYNGTSLGLTGRSSEHAFVTARRDARHRVRVARMFGLEDMLKARSVAIMTKTEDLLHRLQDPTAAAAEQGVKLSALVANWMVNGVILLELGVIVEDNKHGWLIQPAAAQA